MTGILNKATSRSLVIIDEFGKGTLTSDGVGLMAATLEHYALQADPPRVLACTHFSELLQPAVLAPSPQLQFHTMAVVLPGSGLTGDAAAAVEEHSLLLRQSQQQQQQQRLTLGAAGSVQQEVLRQAAAPGAGLAAHMGDCTFLYKLVPGFAAASYGVSAPPVFLGPSMISTAPYCQPYCWQNTSRAGSAFDEWRTASLSSTWQACPYAHLCAAMAL